MHDTGATLQRGAFVPGVHTAGLACRIAECKRSGESKMRDGVLLDRLTLKLRRGGVKSI